MAPEAAAHLLGSPVNRRWPRSSLKERSRVKGWLPCCERFLARFQARLNSPSAWWLRGSMSVFPGCCRFGERAGPGQGPGGEPGRGAAPQASLMRGARAPIMGRREAGVCGCECAPAAASCEGQRLAAVIPSGTRGCRPRGHGAFRVRAAGSIRGTAAPPGRGPDLGAITRCPRPGGPHAACRSRARTCPSRSA